MEGIREVVRGKGFEETRWEKGKIVEEFQRAGE